MRWRTREAERACAGTCACILARAVGHGEAVGPGVLDLPDEVPTEAVVPGVLDLPDEVPNEAEAPGVLDLPGGCRKKP